MMIKRYILFIVLLILTQNLYSAKITVKVFDDSRISIKLKHPGSKQLDFVLKVNETFLSEYTPPIDTRVVLLNNGEVNIGFSLALQMQSSGIVPVTTEPGLNEFRLFGIFHQWNSNPLKSDFEEDDIFTAEFQDSSTNVFTKLSSKEEDKGFNVTPDKKQSLFLRFDAPSSISQNPAIINCRIFIKAFMSVEQEEPHKKPEEKIFTPNGDGINDLVVFHGLSEKLEQGGFQIKIFDVRGRLIRVINDVEFWDGKDSEGQIVRNGVYLYQYIYENKYETGVVIVAK